MKRVITTLQPTPPYNFDLTAAYATYFRGRYGSDRFESGVFQRLLNTGTPLRPEEALDYSYRWSPYRSYVTVYLFTAMRSGYVFPSI